MNRDPLTTAMNVLGGAVAAAVVDGWNQKEFRRLESFERDLHMVEDLVRLNQALEETLEEEDEEEQEEEEDEEKRVKMDEDNQEVGQSEISIASASDAEVRPKRRRKTKTRKRVRRKMFGTSAVGRLLDKALADRPPTPYWARATPHRRGSELVKKSVKHKSRKKKLKVASSRSSLSKTSEEARNPAKRKSKAIKLRLPKLNYWSKKSVSPAVNPHRSTVSKKKSKSKKGKKTSKAKPKADELELHEENEVDNTAVPDNEEEVVNDEIPDI